jgi:hypothetical protein
MFLPDVPITSSVIDERLSEWFRQHLTRPPLSGQYEVEAKLGLLMYKNSSQRISLQDTTETVLYDSSMYRFESNIPLDLHRRFNGLLNSEVSKGRLSYRHTRTVDQMYRGSSYGHDKVRVTRDQGGRMVACIEKKRVADLAIFFPEAPFDVRISINVEIPLEGPSGFPEIERKKDRMSYVFLGKESRIQLDLTQVKQSGEDFPRHELELEVIDPVILASSSKAVTSFSASLRNIVRAAAVHFH